MVRRLSKVAGAALAGLGIAALMGLNTTSARADDKAAAPAETTPLRNPEHYQYDFKNTVMRDIFNSLSLAQQRYIYIKLMNFN